MTIFAFIVLVIMLVQYFLIRKKSEETDKWSDVLHFYQMQIRGSTIIWFLVTCLMLAALLFDTFKTNSIGIRESIVSETMLNKGPHFIFLITFYTGVIKLFFERMIDDAKEPLAFCREIFQSFFNPIAYSKASLSHESIAQSKTSDNGSWFWWFLISILIALLQYIYSTYFGTPSSSPSMGNSESIGIGSFFVGLFAIFTISVGYYSWFYMIMFEKLTSVHHFSGHAARAFLGKFFHSELPEQILLIGPSGSGKSSFKKGDAVSDATTIIEISSESTTDESGYTKKLTFIDPPGENMGDHLHIATLLRADTIVLTLDVNWLDSSDIGNIAKYEIDRWQDLLAPQFSREKDYLRSFFYATRRDKSFIRAQDLFKARSFLLFFNDYYSEERNQRYSDLSEHINEESLDHLTNELGARFGVEKNNCQWYVGDAKTISDSYKLVAKPPCERSKKTQ